MQLLARPSLVVALALVALSPTRAAHAYCFTSTCKGKSLCFEEEAPGCLPTRWVSRCVGFAVNDKSVDGISAEDLREVTARAFLRWRSADCGDGAPPGLFAEYMGKVECDVAEYNRDAGNANIVVMTKSPDDDDLSGHTFALTTTSFDPNTGELLGADIELNFRDHTFSIGDEEVLVDLEAVLTHEVGHFLGIAHSEDVEATMFPFYEEGTTEIRTLSEDDATAICILYPPDRDIDATCNPLPRHGFSPMCRENQTEGGCNASSRRAGPAWIFTAGAALVLAALSGRRRRRRTARRDRRT